MREWKSQSHVKWYCKYHIVFSPKYRKKAMFGSLRKGVGKIKLRDSWCNQSSRWVGAGEAERLRFVVTKAVYSWALHLADLFDNQEEEEKHQEQQNLREELVVPLPQRWRPDTEGPSSNQVPLCGW